MKTVHKISSDVIGECILDLVGLTSNKAQQLLNNGTNNTHNC